MARANTDRKRSKRSPETRSGLETNPIVRYFRETRGELRKVTWPTQEESLRLTAIVIGVTLFMAMFLFSFDFIFGNAVEAIVTQLAL